MPARRSDESYLQDVRQMWPDFTFTEVVRPGAGKHPRIKGTCPEGHELNSGKGSDYFDLVRGPARGSDAVGCRTCTNERMLAAVRVPDTVVLSRLAAAWPQYVFDSVYTPRDYAAKRVRGSCAEHGEFDVAAGSLATANGAPDQRPCLPCGHQSRADATDWEARTINRAVKRTCLCCGDEFWMQPNQIYCLECGKLQERTYRQARRANGGFTAPLLRAVLLRDSIEGLPHCVHCLVYVDGEEVKMHFDHLLPVSRGGQNTLDNVVVSCERCNTSRANLTVEEWAVSGRPGVPERLKVVS